MAAAAGSFAAKSKIMAITAAYNAAYGASMINISQNHSGNNLLRLLRAGARSKHRQRSAIIALALDNNNGGGYARQYQQHGMLMKNEKQTMCMCVMMIIVTCARNEVF